MTYDVLITPTENGFAAAVLGLPARITEAATRDEALAQAQAEAEELLNKSELVRVEVKDQAVHKSVDAVALTDDRLGIFAHLDDETWDQFQTAMKEVRAEIDANPNRL